MNRTAVIYGWRKPALDADAAAFFRACRPWGFILFAEACVSRAQTRVLVDALKAAAGHDALIFIDQEGGRVARLKPPEWPAFPAAARYGALYGRDPEAGLEACSLGHRLMAAELAALGIHADCAPCLDLPAPGADPIIGDRAFGRYPETVIALGRAAMEGLHEGGVASVIKHAPGHGRADVDSHLALPRVGASVAALASDFAPFTALRDAPMAMTAHVVFSEIDDGAPATQSPRVIGEVIRGNIGFDGLLMTDDLGMKALTGSWWQKAEKAFAAGCDVVLHCSGVLAEMEALAGAIPSLSGDALRRAQAAEAIAARAPAPLDQAAAWARFNALMARAAVAAA